MSQAQDGEPDTGGKSKVDEWLKDAQPSREALDGLASEFFELAKREARKHLEPALRKHCGSADIANSALNSVLSDLVHARYQIPNEDRFRALLIDRVQKRIHDARRKEYAGKRDARRTKRLDEPPVDPKTDKEVMQEAVEDYLRFMMDEKDEMLRYCNLLCIMNDFDVAQVQRVLDELFPGKVKRLRALQLHVEQKRFKAAEELGRDLDDA